MIPEAARKYDFARGEYRKWADEYHQVGVEPLETNRKDQEAKHQADIKRLRAKAEAALGPKWDERAFHDAVLENGPVPMDVLEAHIDDWIAARKG